MSARSRWVATVAGLSIASLLGAGVQAGPNANTDVGQKTKLGAVQKEQWEAEQLPAECREVAASPLQMPSWYAQRCVRATKNVTTNETESSLAPTASRGPILMQEVSTNTVRFSTVAGIATTTSFGALVPASATDFPADLIRIPGDPQRVYQITTAGAVSRYNTSGVNTVLAPIPAAAGSTWSDTATDPTSGQVYGSAIVGACVSSTLSRIDPIAGTMAAVGPITGGGCIISIAADNAGNLFGIDIVADNLVAINKVTGAGTVVGPIGFNSNFGQGFDCDPATNICYMFTINVTTANSADLRTVNTGTGATALSGTIGSVSPGGAVQVGGAVFETITDTCAIDADCQDGNLCNGVETCVATVCQPGAPVVCDDGLFCTQNLCTPGTGLCSFPANPCGDGDTCTVDSCDEAGDVCTHSTPTPVQFCNTGAITINASGIATPYPATITVSGLGTSAALCSVQLQGISHTWPGDIDVLLVGPVATTQNATIMSDVATGNFPVTNVNLTLKDSAATNLPAGGPLVSGTFKPTNAAIDTFPAPAPVANVSPSLAIFGGNPNGTWRLYINDDFTGDSGTMAQGWCLNIVPTGCSTAADCNDGNVCTDDACTNSVCVFSNNTAACTDGNACTLNDACSGGACVGGAPQVCNDGNACTANNCNTGTGACEFPAIVCNDTNTCTDDTCDPGSGCVFTPNNLNACTDNNLCTTPDLCVNGACVGQNPVVCTPDSNICTTEACNPATGNCVSTGNTIACDDLNVCTSGDTCGPALTENWDGETAPNLPPTWTTSASGDGDPWVTVSTSSDTPPNSAFGFDGPGPLVSDELLISPPINITTASAKLTFRNRWSLENATTCFDGGVLEIDIAGGGFTDIVAAGGSFVSGGYTGTVSTGFSSTLAGRPAWCNVSAGFPAYLTTVVNLPAAAAGQTIQLQWRIGTDVSIGAPGQNIDSIVLVDGENHCNPGTGTTDCNDSNACTDDFCDSVLGCQHANNTDGCNDGNACTILDACNAGSCGGQALVCNDSNPCTLDTCDSGSGCQFTPILAPGEVQNVSAAPDKSTYNWSATAGATQYDVVRGNVSALPVGPGGGDETCFSNLPSATVNDPTVPGAGVALWYLSRAENTCGNGTYGNQGLTGGAPGAARVTTTCP